MAPRLLDYDELRRLHAAGLTDRQMAERMAVGLDAVRSARQRFRLKPHDGRACPDYRRRLGDAVRAAHAAAGNAGPAKARRLKAERRAELATRYGLPADLKPVQVAVLVALSGGPLVIGELADVCGQRPAFVKDFDRFNHSGVRGKNYLTNLRQRGLVASVRYDRRRDAVYTLTAACMDLLSGAGRDQGRNDCRGGAAGAAEGDPIPACERG